MTEPEILQGLMPSNIKMFSERRSRLDAGNTFIGQMTNCLRACVVEYEKRKMANPLPGKE